MSSVLVRNTRSALWLGELRACLALSWPLILTNAIEMAMNITSLAMIGHISPEALAASTVAMALHNLFLLFGIGVTAAVSPLAARAIGVGGDAGATVRRVVQQGLWGAAIMAGPMWLILWNARPLFIAAGQDPAVATEATTYLHALQWSLLPALVYLVLRSFLAVLGQPRWTVVAGIVGVVLNAVLNWLLIDGHGGLPALGLVGSGFATLLSNIVMAAVLVLIATVHPALRGARIFSGILRPPWRGFATFWRLGLPIGVSLLLETGMFTAATALVGHFEIAALAAHAIAIQVATLTFMVPLGLAQAATIRIGRASGAGDGEGVLRAGWTALGVGLLTMIVSAATLITAPRLIIGLFIDGGEPGSGAVSAVGVTLLGLAGLFQIADGAQVVLGGMLRGLQDTRAPMLIAAFGYWGIGLPLSALLAFTLQLRAPGVWLGMTAGLFTVAGLLLVRWRVLLGRTREPGSSFLLKV